MNFAKCLKIVLIKNCLIFLLSVSVFVSFSFATERDFNGNHRTGKYTGDTLDIGAFEYIPGQDNPDNNLVQPPAPQDLRIELDDQ